MIVTDLRAFRKGDMYKNDLPPRFPPVDLDEPGFAPSLEKELETKFDVSVIVPTRNEAGNIEPLLARISKAMKGIPTEVIFVDDSTDDTLEVIRDLMGWFPVHVDVIARPPERRKNGLGGAVVEGMARARAPWVCVMDADLQHPPELIPQLFRHAQHTRSDIVVGSRLAPGGEASSLGLKRSIISHVFAFTTRVTFPKRLMTVTDPLSGYFLTRRSALNLEQMRPDGFKILLEIMVSHPQLKISEIPMHFGHRNAGESKASIQETIKFFKGLFRLRLAGNENFIKFLGVGASGLVVNSLALALFTEYGSLHYLVSALLATQISTLWNFGLTESWVFKRRETNRPFVQRLFSFLAINNLLLLLRGPIMSLMVTQLGIHYLISNLVSLFAMTLLRYFVSDQWIWNPGKRTRSQQAQTINRRDIMVEPKQESVGSNARSLTANSDTFAYSYNIHNILRVASMFKLPELEYFRVASLFEEPDIRLRLERRHRERRRSNTNSEPKNRRSSTPRRLTGQDIRYSESLGRYGFAISIAYKDQMEVAVSLILKFSLHVLYTNVVEPVLRWALVRKGYALVHAACIAVDGRAVLITARTDTGKTSTILRAVDNYSCSFLSDDMTIVSRDGEVMSYPKPLTISNHTLSAVNGNSSLTFLERIALQIQSRLHSKSGRSVGMKLSQGNLPAATMNAIVQMLIPPPKYMVHRLIPKATYINHATLSRAVIIERGPEFEETLKHEQAVETFVNNAEDAYGFPPYPILADSLSRWDNVDLHPYEQAIVAKALEKIPTIRLRDPQFNWWQKLPVISGSVSTASAQFTGADD